MVSNIVLHNFFLRSEISKSAFCFLSVKAFVTFSLSIGSNASGLEPDLLIKIFNSDCISSIFDFLVELKLLINI